MIKSYSEVIQSTLYTIRDKVTSLCTSKHLFCRLDSDDVLGSGWGYQPLPASKCQPLIYKPW